jgi:acetyl esterase/lipase
MNYHTITPEMTIKDLITSGAYGAFADYIFTDMTPDRFYITLKQYGFEKCGFEEGLHRMEELAASDGRKGASYVYDVYCEEERLANYDKARVKLLYFPVSDPSPKPYAVIIPGGGFNRQWGFIEGEAIAAHLNSLGYPAFVLYYRVKQEPLLPEPIEDMHRAVAFIEANTEKFHVLSGHYMIGGFSAGAAIAQEMGSTNFGWNAPAAEIDAGSAGTIHWKKTSGPHAFPDASLFDWSSVQIPKPELIFLGYTACMNSASLALYRKAENNPKVRAALSPFLRRVGGPFFEEASLAPYEIFQHMDETWPKTFLVANEDDPTVPIINTKMFDAQLTKLGVPHKTEIGKTGGHSFGLGYGLDVEGWLDRCVSFWQE